MGCRDHSSRRGAGPTGDRRLYTIQRLVRQGLYMLSRHVLEPIEDGEFSQDDLETSVLTGEVKESQADECGTAIDGRKYTIHGRATGGMPFETVGKIIEGPDGRMYFFITAYRCAP